MFERAASVRVAVATSSGQGTAMLAAEPYRCVVVDLGMQVKGWTTEQAAAYLRAAMPLRPPERAVQSVALISGNPGFVLAYPLGDLEWVKMRSRAETSLGKKFDVRAFHEMELEDGMLPFAALEEKLDRWISAGGPAS